MACGRFKKVLMINCLYYVKMCFANSSNYLQYSILHLLKDPPKACFPKLPLSLYVSKQSAVLKCHSWHLSKQCYILPKWETLSTLGSLNLRYLYYGLYFWKIIIDWTIMLLFYLFFNLFIYSSLFQFCHCRIHTL